VAVMCSRNFAAVLRAATRGNESVIDRLERHQLPTPNLQLPTPKETVCTSWVEAAPIGDIGAIFTGKVRSDRFGSWKLEVGSC
jgi:hypothetical protein